MLLVSEVCGHRLHGTCLAQGLRVQLRDGQSSSMRCPACVSQLAVPVPPEIVRAALVDCDELAMYEVSEQQKWRRGGHGTLFRICPSGACRVRPAKANCTMQVMCKCAAAHRFCCYCGKPPHEPVPCAYMIELCDFLDNLRRDAQGLLAKVFEVGGGADADRLALLSDIDRAADTGSAITSEPIAPRDEAPLLETLDLRRLHKEYQHLLGERPAGVLRSSAETAVVLLRHFDLHPLAVDIRVGTEPEHASTPHGLLPPLGTRLSDEAPQQSKNSEELLEATTRPCPRCFVPIQRAGGCIHMTCANTRCLHQFCWLCLQDWTSPSHDSSRCAMRLDDPSSGALGNDEVMAVVEQRILTTWDAQPMETRPSRDTYAAEVRHRFGKALSVVLDSDRDLIYNDEPPAMLHLNFRLMCFYDQQERRCRRLAEAVFSKDAVVADGPKLRDGFGDLNGLLGWLRARWWLRLDPEDAAVHLAGERPPLDRRMLNEQMRATQLRAEHALHCFQSREAKTRQTELQSVAVEGFLRRFAQTMPGNAWSEAKQLLMELVAQSEQMHSEHASRTAIASQVAEIGTEAHKRLLLDVNRSLALGFAACCAWRANRLLELVGALKPIRGEEAKRVALAASQWADATESRRVALRGLLGQWLGAPGDPDPVAWRYQIAFTASLLDAARRRLFELALEYCGGTRSTVRRRGQR